MLKTYIPLHVHTQSSFLDGFINTKEYVKFCSEQGFPGCAITDHGSLASAIEFYQACQEYNINPIIGCEMYITKKFDGDPVRDNFHVNLFAKNEQGWRDLVTIYNEANLNRFYYKPRTHINVLKNLSSNLICSAACMGGEIQQAFLKGSRGEMISKIKEYHNIFKDDFYLELVLAEIKAQVSVNKEILSLVENNFKKLKYIITTDAHYLKKEDEQYQDLLLKVQRRGFTFQSKNHFVPTTEQLYDLVKTNHPYISEQQLEKAIKSSHEINNKVNIDFSKWIGKINMSEFNNELNIDNKEYFKKMLFEKFEEFLDNYERYNGHISDELLDEYEERLKYEYNVLAKSGSYLYILQVRDIVDRAKKLKKEKLAGLVKIGDKIFQGDEKLVVLKKDYLSKKDSGEIIFTTLADGDSIKEVVLNKEAKIIVSDEMLIGPGRGCFLPGQKVKTKQSYLSIEKIREGHRVLTHDTSYQKVLNRFEYDCDEECIRISLSNGKKIECTKDHEIMVKNFGWKKAEELTKEDILQAPITNKRDKIDWECVDCGMKKKVRLDRILQGRNKRCLKCTAINLAQQPGRKKQLLKQAQTNKSEASREKNRKTIKRLMEETDLKERISEGVKEFFKNNPASVEKAQTALWSAVKKDPSIMDQMNKQFHCGEFYSKKNNCKIFYQSSFELKALNVLETDTEVEEFGRFNELIEYEFNKKQHVYKPDYWYKKNNQYFILEVKADHWYKKHKASVDVKNEITIKYANESEKFTGFEMWKNKELNLKNDLLHNDIYIEKIETFHYKGKVYDLEVEKAHNYTINNVSVHNSAAGSLVCYILGITSIDPIKRDLLFERFVNPTRLFGGFQPGLSCLSYADYCLKFHDNKYDEEWKLNELDCLKEHLDEIENEIKYFKKNNAESYIYYLYKEGYKETKNIYNSWLFYYLGITQEKPTSKFEIHYSQPTFPDIDVDFSDKTKAVDLLTNTYTSSELNNGLTKRRSYPVATFGQIKCKGAIKDVAKVIESIIEDYSKDFEEIKKENEKKFDMSEEDLNETKETWEQNKKIYMERYNFANKKNLSFENINAITREMPPTITYEELEAEGTNPLFQKAPEVMKAVKYLENTRKYMGTHASAVCIIPEDLIDCVPIARSGQDYIIGLNDKQACGGDYDNNLGLIKNDILGLTALHFLQQSQKMVATKVEIEFENKKIFLDYETEVGLRNGDVVIAGNLKAGDDIVNIYG